MIEFDISAIVPKFILNDRNGYAMAKAIEKAMTIFCAVCKSGVDTVLDVDKMPIWRLKECAWEYGILWFDATVDIDEMREQIKNANRVYRTLGTKDGLNRAIESMFGDGFIEEWNAYGGQPYHYKVYATDDRVIYSKLSNFNRLISIVPNVRSILDAVEVVSTNGESNLYMSVAAVGIYEQTTKLAE